MHEPHPRDWTRFEREMRVWGRKFEREMREMGERMERDMKDGVGQSFCGAEDATEETRRSTRDHRHTGPIWMWDWDKSPRARRAARRAARAAARAAAQGVAEGVTRGMTGRSRAERRAKRCDAGGWAGYWWVVFPLFFIGKNAFVDAGGFAGLSNGVQGFVEWSLNFSLIAPLAHLFSRVVGLSFIEAFSLLAAAGVVSAGAALIAWRMGRPQDASQPL